MASFSGITTVPATQPGLADPDPLLSDWNDLEHQVSVHDRTMRVPEAWRQSGYHDSHPTRTLTHPIALFRAPSGNDFGDTLAGITRNRLCRYRGVGVLARCQRECRAFESPHPL
jgi:hypothetical protein